MNKKIIVSVVLVILIFLAIFYLTLQSKEDTSALSHKVYSWTKSIGLPFPEAQLRHYAHIVEYFALGFALSILAKQANEAYWKVVVSGSLLGLCDECLKILLPVRHFDKIDVMLDIVGVLLGLLAFLLFNKLFLNSSDATHAAGENAND